jgi:hypothetical protein
MLIMGFLRSFGFLRQRQNLCVILDLISCAALYPRVEGPQTQVLAIISHWLVQDVVCLRLKIAKNFKLNENPEIKKP